MFNVFAAFKVHNGEIEDTIQSSAGGGYKISWNVEEWNERELLSKTHEDFVIKSEENKKEYEFPFNDKYYFKAEGLKIKEIYKTEDDEKVTDVPQNLNTELHKDYYEANFVLPLKSYVATDNTAQALANQYADGHIKAIWGRHIHKVRLHYNYITPENTEDIYDKYPKKEEYSYHSAWLQKGSDDDSSIEHALKFNHCFADLEDTYLFGIHGGKLIKFDKSGNVELLGDKLKNFRLSKLKKMSKAREQSQ